MGGIDYVMKDFVCILDIQVKGVQMDYDYLLMVSLALYGGMAQVISNGVFVFVELIELHRTSDVVSIED